MPDKSAFPLAAYFIGRTNPASASRDNMDLRAVGDSESRFSAYVEGLVSVIGHADRAGPLRDYCLGLMMPCERKSVEPMAAVTAPGRTAAQHQSLLHFVGNAAWSDEKVLAKAREMVLPAIERQGPIEAWIIDDTGFPKKGEHSVGVARQYCGQLGKQDNCQVAVSLSLANHHASLPVAYRLYLPEDWAEDSKRRRKTGVPEDIVLQDQARDRAGADRGGLQGRPSSRRGADGCGLRLQHGPARRRQRARAVLCRRHHAADTVWASGTGPLPPKKWSGRGRQPKLIRRDAKHQPVSVKELALGLPKRAWRRIEWREGAAERLSSRFARVRVRVAHRDYNLTESRPEEWLLIEWPKGEDAPTKYWLSTLPQDITFRSLVDMAKLRWRIERDYQELKQEVGLGHFEGRGWRGFHHHATLCIAAYGFLISERETIPPSGPRSTTLFPQPAVPDGYRPRGSAVAA